MKAPLSVGLPVLALVLGAVPVIASQPSKAAPQEAAPQDRGPSEPRLAPVISSGMVLQRGAKAALFGTAPVGAEVSLEISWTVGEPTTRATANEDGRWQMSVDVPKAIDEPAMLRFSLEDADPIIVQDVLVGEVWLCSGQSNMEWPLRNSIVPARKSSGLASDVLALERPHIRFFTVPHTRSLEPLGPDTAWTDARWTSARGSAALDCSAAAYFFACRVQDSLDVPIGIIHTSVGGTPAEAWTPAATVERFPRHGRALTELKEVAQLERERGPATAARKAEAFLSKLRGAEFAAAPAALDSDDWLRATGRHATDTRELATHDGVIWLQSTVEIPAAFAGKDLTLDLPAVDDLDVTFWQDSVVGATLEAGAWNRARRYSVPAALAASGTATITICCIDTGGAAGLNGDAPARVVCEGEAARLSPNWRAIKGPSLTQLPFAPAPTAITNWTPSVLWNAMVAPLVPYTVRGVLWYQGEANRANADEYRALFPSMIVSWRQAWNDLQLPFYFVQIAPFDYDRITEDPDDALGTLRQAQAGALRLPNTRMALTADIGNPRDIHPVNKWDVGDRLARFALFDVYGDKDADPLSPSPSSAVRTGSTLVVTFAHVGAQLVAPAELTGFEVADQSGKFVAATAILGENGSTIELVAPDVTAPTQARYLWSDSGAASVFGESGLPVAPFVISL